MRRKLREEEGRKDEFKNIGKSTAESRQLSTPAGSITAVTANFVFYACSKNLIRSQNFLILQVLQGLIDVLDQFSELELIANSDQAKTSELAK
ncbi:hypothetical protein AMTR_s00019p00238700 [Amborella trichopoda]|uniref:Uncharacterized protein n=1 Tax=Amborella trichopoda TaxID=13333 RepID=W1PJU7_AMBTC|nr:hypothetical protein AMTR_s00019p00238700 [Amborella trichopoda]